MHRFWIFVALLALLGVGCSERVSSGLDEDLEEYRELRNKSEVLSCACYQIIGGGQLFTSEQECLDAPGTVTAESLECMKDALAAIHEDEEQSVALIQCYNAALQERNECKEPNVGVCSTEVFNQCVYSGTRALDDCNVGLSEDQVSDLLGLGCR